MRQLYRRYTWAGNKIDPNHMAELHKIKETTGKPITEQVAEAVKEYVAGR